MRKPLSKGLPPCPVHTALDRRSRTVAETGAVETWLEGEAQPGPHPFLPSQSLRVNGDCTRDQTQLETIPHHSPFTLFMRHPTVPTSRKGAWTWPTPSHPPRAMGIIKAGHLGQTRRTLLRRQPPNTAPRQWSQPFQLGKWMPSGGINFREASRTINPLSPGSLTVIHKARQRMVLISTEDPTIRVFMVHNRVTQFSRPRPRRDMTRPGGAETPRQSLPVQFYTLVLLFDPKYRTEHRQQLYDFISLSRAFSLATWPFNIVEFALTQEPKGCFLKQTRHTLSF